MAEELIVVVGEALAAEATDHARAPQDDENELGVLIVEVAHRVVAGCSRRHVRGTLLVAAHARFLRACKLAKRRRAIADHVAAKIASHNKHYAAGMQT